MLVNVSKSTILTCFSITTKEHSTLQGQHLCVSQNSLQRKAIDSYNHFHEVILTQTHSVLIQYQLQPWAYSLLLSHETSHYCVWNLNGPCVQKSDCILDESVILVALAVLDVIWSHRSFNTQFCFSSSCVCWHRGISSEAV